MQFGFKAAPAHFQKTITITLEPLSDGRIVIYIDDIALWALDGQQEALWQRTLAVLHALTAAGFMINVRKSKLMVRRASIVGMHVEDGLYCPLDKPLKKLFGEAPPKDLAGLQRLLGQLNYLRRFVPGYAAMVAPIQKLVAQGPAAWDSSCTEARNAICNILAARLPLALPRCGEQFYIWLDANQEGMSAIITQPRE
jgi:hypothetical protein